MGTTDPPFKYQFHIDGDDSLRVLGHALVFAVSDIEKVHDLTLTLNNTTIDVVPLGNGLKQIILKVKP
jgi:hypothetical protein